LAAHHSLVGRSTYVTVVVIEEVEVTLRLTVSQYVLVSSTLVGLVTRYYFLSECCCLKFAVLYLWSALSDVRTGLQFAGVITQWSESLRTRNHTLLSHLKLPQPGGLGSRSYIPQEQGGPVIPPGIGFPLRRLLRLASYDSQDYGGGILTLPLPGGTGPCIYSLQE
jgi:hypothetical protein